MKTRAFCIAALLALASLPAIAQEAKCNGPQELCTQVLELKKDLASQKSLSEKTTTLSVAKKQQEEHRSAQLIALAASLAVGLKLLVSMLKSWTSWLQTDKQKAAMKAALLLLGFGSFITGNLALGLPWWQALIVAGGPPGAILVHELMDLILVFKGKEPLPSNLDPTKEDQPAPPAAPPGA